MSSLSDTEKLKQLYIDARSLRVAHQTTCEYRHAQPQRGDCWLCDKLDQHVANILALLPPEPISLPGTGQEALEMMERWNRTRAADQQRVPLGAVAIQTEVTGAMTGIRQTISKPPDLWAPKGKP